MQKNIITAALVALVAVVGVSGCGTSERAGQAADAAKVQMVEDAVNGNPDLQPEDYWWPRCEEEDADACVWVAEEQGNGEGESFLALSDGDVVPLNHEQALAMVGEE